MSSAPPPFPGMRAGADAGDERRRAPITCGPSLPAPYLARLGTEAVQQRLRPNRTPTSNP